MKQLELESASEDLRKMFLGSTLEFLIPGHPPSVNKLYATVRGRRVKARIGRQWSAHCARLIHNEMLRSYGVISLASLRGFPIEFSYEVMRPSWRAKSGSGLFVRPDLGNFEKALCDSVMEALNLDDSAIVAIHAFKLEASGPERTLVRIKFLTEDIWTLKYT